MGLKEIRNAKKKEEILRSAAKIVTCKGYHGATMEDIAAELLMTKGALYYYFNSKEDLIYQCHELILSEAICTLESYLEENISSEDKLKKAIITHIDFAIKEKETFNLIVKPEHTFSLDRLHPMLKKRLDYARIFDAIIQQGIDNGEFKIQETTMARMMLLGAMNWVQQWYSPAGKRSKEEISEIYSEYLIKIVK
ncbi:TetR/AcrR family transcriptional regulator [Alkalihalobacterium alkalinitrilicum]|uniref:TetR/AcrR family transcriptional regulator n=1 Tax=Alkalihalobacterium alkalinitrilicum TaxID=427920 RepID=UPI000994BC30|nr:TetR/AcrR family transcriptional regulator [Alkalihalobacterium alkalinitrilicum]